MATETTGIDMDQNYVTVTLCIINWQHEDAAIVRCGPSVRRSMNFYDRGFVPSGLTKEIFRNIVHFGPGGCEVLIEAGEAAKGDWGRVPPCSGQYGV